MVLLSVFINSNYEIVHFFLSENSSYVSKPYSLEKYEGKNQNVWFAVFVRLCLTGELGLVEGRCEGGGQLLPYFFVIAAAPRLKLSLTVQFTTCETLADALQ